MNLESFEEEFVLLFELTKYLNISIESIEIIDENGNRLIVE